MATIPTHVDRMYQDFDNITNLLLAEPSLAIAAGDIFRKNLLLASASYFERMIKEILLEYVRETTNENQRIVEFVRQKVLVRGYHQLFDWTRPNANQFWSSFGPSFRSAMIERIRRDAELDAAVRAFLELGNDRNRLVHEDFGSFALDKTAEEIYTSYRTALHFVESLPNILRNSEGPT